MLIVDIMQSDIAECTEDTPLSETYQLVQSSPTGFVVVVDSTMHRVPLGIVNEHTMCENLVRGRRETRRLRAGDVMSSRIRTVSENCSVEDCAALLSDLPDAAIAVDGRRQFSGVIEPAALRRAMMRSRRSTSARMLSTAPVVELPAFGWLK